MLGGVEGGEGGGREVRWFGLLGTSLLQGVGVGEGGLVLKIFVFVLAEVYYLLVACSGRLWLIERWMSESIQKVIPMFCVQCVKCPGGHCTVCVTERMGRPDLRWWSHHTVSRRVGMCNSSRRRFS